MTHPFRSTAASLLACGYSPIPIAPGTKRPAMSAWQRACKSQLCDDIIDKYARQSAPFGVGIALGYQGLIALDIDSDDPEIVSVVRGVVPPSPVAKSGKRGRTDFYLDETGSIRSRRLSGPSGMLLEILAHGCQTVIPPTVHPETGNPYRWIGSLTLIDVAVADLPVLPPGTAERLEEALRPWMLPSTPSSIRRPPLSLSGAPISEVERVRQFRYAKSILERELHSLAAMPPDSGRNRAVYRLVCRIGRWCHAGILPMQRVVSEIEAATEANCLIRDDGLRSVHATIASGFQASRHDELPDLGAGRGRGSGA